MNIKTVASIALGILIGSLATQLFVQDKKIPKTLIDSPSFPKNENTITETPISDSEINSPKTEINSTIANSPNTHAQNPVDVLLCLEHLKPSDINDWRNKWQDKVNHFLSTNDQFWNSKGNRSFDKDQFPSSIGKYKGVWEMADSPNLKLNVSIELTSDIKGQYKVEGSYTKGSPVESETFQCWSDIIPRKDLGSDEKENALNVFMLNCSPTYLGSIYSQFAFKLPRDLTKNQKKRLEVYGLNENFDWKSVGFIDLIHI